MTTRVSVTNMGPKNVIIEEKHVDTEIDANQPTELLPLEMSEHHVHDGVELRIREAKEG